MTEPKQKELSLMKEAIQPSLGSISRSENGGYG